MYEWIAFLENALNNNFTFSVIFVLGMFHALEPGHGKTLILAYMSGGSIRFAGTIQLILGLIITHFLLFSLIAFLLQIGSESFPFLNAIGPLLIILLGIYLLYRSVKEVRHEHDDECDEPMHFHFNQSKFSSPFITGTVAGLIPCPSAIAVLLIAIMVLFLLFKDQFSKQLNSINQKFNTNLIAAVIIILIGILYFLMNFYGLGHQH